MAQSDKKIKKLVNKIKSLKTRLQVLNELFDIETSTSDRYQMFKEILLLSVKNTFQPLNCIL